MSSFFLKGKPRTATKRKFQEPDKKDKKPKASKAAEPESEEEIDSDDEEERTIASASRKFNFEDEEDGLTETAQDKRLRLAKKYLKGVEEAEREQAEDREDEEDLDGNVSAALREDYLESIGKLYREVADSYRGFNLDRAVTLRHKQQNLSPTCLCLTEDDRFLYVANKNGIVVRWNVATGEKLAATKPQRTAVHSLAISHDLRFLVVADGTSEIKVLNGETLEKVNSLSGHSDVVTGVVFRRNTHTLYSCSKDRTVKVWSLDEMLYVETLYGHQSPVTSIDALSRECHHFRRQQRLDPHLEDRRRVPAGVPAASGHGGQHRVRPANRRRTLCLVRNGRFPVGVEFRPEETTGHGAISSRQGRWKRGTELG